MQTTTRTYHKHGFEVTNVRKTNKWNDGVEGTDEVSGWVECEYPYLLGDTREWVVWKGIFKAEDIVVKATYH